MINFERRIKEEKIYKILNVINQILDEMQIIILSQKFGIISSEIIRPILEKNWNSY